MPDTLLQPTPQDRGGPLPPRVDEDGKVVYGIRTTPGMTAAEINAAAEAAMAMPLPDPPST